MSEPQNQFDQAPVYGAPPAPPQPVATPEEPARLNWLQRLTGVWFSPSETFEDVNRKPTILAPIIISVLVIIAAVYVTNWKLGPYMPTMMREQIRKTMERFGQTPSKEQLDEAVRGQLQFAKFTPLVAAVFTPITYAVIAGIFALGMMFIQAKTTFKKIYSVILWTFSSISIISTIVFIVSLMVKDEESLQSIDLNNPWSSVATNLGVLLDSSTSPVLRAIASSVDAFSLWIIIVLSIGLAKIAGSKSIKTSKTATVVVGLYAIYVLGRIGFAAFLG